MLWKPAPQFAEDVRARRLVDRIGYGDEAQANAQSPRRQCAKTIAFNDYARNSISGLGEAISPGRGSREIRDGTNKSSWIQCADGIASDDLSARSIRRCVTRNIKAIVLRVDSPGGSVTASDQILHRK